MASPQPSRKPPSGTAAERARQVVARMVGRAPITDRLNLAGDLGLDAADRAELVVAIELACRMDLPPAEAAAANSVGDLIALVETAQAAADEALREAVEDLVAGAAARGQPIDLSAAARVLAEEHRSTSLELIDIIEVIAKTIETAHSGRPNKSALNSRRRES